MKVKFESSFEKDLKLIKDAKLLQKLKSVIIECKNSDKLLDIKNLQKLKGYNTFYRIRIGNYRLGIEVEKDTLIFTRFLHRKDIYKFFP
ncbi:type II toxin-antitoxin system mRNA interferase toxin, RelE/StbE family [Crocosphaera sp.]|uniref:type II toxin-antitoxin system RelE family toxin n=1 Tax=Crocosphaera sp. TaxID=2729996 RepID=UPI00260836F0|nr:type II toxin-antitoxin system mRNA interferase toxin, RelE/StbE family [Crocosphaera sp.]MDJ0578877.1 type II toxin-antitoxin system mRNA interferase toxin, RelE/StbE family [Crocosphaera sp.]